MKNDIYMRFLISHINREYGNQNQKVMPRKGDDGNELLLPVNGFHGLPDELIKKCFGMPIANREKIRATVANLRTIFPETLL